MSGGAALNMPADNATYVLIKLQPGYEANAVRDVLRAKLPDSEVLTKAGWLGGLLVVVAMGTAEIRVRECCDVGSPRVECC